MGGKLKLLLIQRRMRQYEVARALGIDETRFSRIVCERVKPTEDELARIATYFGCDGSDLFKAA